MAKTKISEYDSTAANNTDIDSINIAEGCAPSGINNAIRELMAHLKDMNISSTITMLNDTEEDTDGGRANKIIFKGEQSGGEESTLAEIQASHDGASDDEKGDLIFRTNDGSDGSSPTERMRIDSAGNVDFINTVTAARGIGDTLSNSSATGSITLDFSATQNFILTLTGNVTLANPSTETLGQSGMIAFIQDGTGSRTVSLGGDYETAGGSGLTLTTTAGATDLVPYFVVAENRVLLGTPTLAFS